LALPGLRPTPAVDPSNKQQAQKVKAWREYHHRFCSGEPAELVLAHKFEADCLVLGVPGWRDTDTIGRTSLSPSAVTLAEALLAGAATLLELEPNEIAAFPRRSLEAEEADEIVFYETVPGGAGYLHEMARRLPEVAAAARERLYEHECARACYLCLKHYRNQRWHAFFDKDRVRDILLEISRMEQVLAAQVIAGAGVIGLERMLQQRREELKASGKAPGTPGPESPIEARLLDALRALPDLPPPVPQYEVKDGERAITIPDFAYPEERIAVFCDGFAFHGNPETLELDARKRNWLQSKEGGQWLVLTYWGKTIMRDPEACAREIAQAFRQRRSRAES
jgi:hypothetical protein